MQAAACLPPVSKRIYRVPPPPHFPQPTDPGPPCTHLRHGTQNLVCGLHHQVCTSVKRRHRRGNATATRCPGATARCIGCRGADVGTTGFIGPFGRVGVGGVGGLITKEGQVPPMCLVHYKEGTMGVTHCGQLCRQAGRSRKYMHEYIKKTSNSRIEWH